MDYKIGRISTVNNSEIS